MADPRFFKKRKPLSLGEIALLTGAKLRDASMESVMISDVASISTAKPVSYTHLTLPTNGLV